MAVCVVIPSSVKLQSHRNLLKPHLFLTKISHISAQRRFYCESYKLNHLSILKAPKCIAPPVWMPSGIQKEKILFRCCCVGSWVTHSGAISSSWVPTTDQVLLLATLILTYVAGVIPLEKSPFSSQTSISQDDVHPENSPSPGREMRKDDEIYLQFAWDVVKGKLRDSLSAIETGVDISERVTEFERSNKKLPSSLSAIAEGPRMRLLWASYQLFYKEVMDISGTSVMKSSIDFSATFAQIIQNCCQNLCTAWLEEELRLISQKPDKKLPSLVSEKINVFENLIQIIRKSGKEDLYSGLIHALKFGSSRNGGYYAYSLFSEHGVAILEDLLITLADGVSSIYLELISVDSGLSNEMNNLGLSLCTMSTRELQRLRNEVALHQWLHQNMEAVVSMYEDRFELCTLQRQIIEEPSFDEAENFSWWKKFSLRRSSSISSKMHFVVIKHVSVPFKRTTELRALTGWRYYFSLFLELADIAMPFIRTIVAKVSDAISFFLVCLIGRSLGLIYSGIRQSLRWK